LFLAVLGILLARLATLRPAPSPTIGEVARDRVGPVPTASSATSPAVTGRPDRHPPDRGRPHSRHNAGRTTTANARVPHRPRPGHRSRRPRRRLPATPWRRDPNRSPFGIVRELWMPVVPSRRRSSRSGALCTSGCRPANR
jgi:hypothetical protein